MPHRFPLLDSCSAQFACLKFACPFPFARNSPARHSLALFLSDHLSRYHHEAARGNDRFGCNSVIRSAPRNVASRNSRQPQIPSKGYRRGATVNATTAGQVNRDTENEGSQKCCPTHLNFIGLGLDLFHDDILKIFTHGDDTLGKLPDRLCARDNPPAVGAEGNPLAIVLPESLGRKPCPVLSINLRRRYFHI